MTALGAGPRGVGLLVAVALLGMPAGARGQTPASSPTPRTFGTVSVVSHTVPAESFGPYDLAFGDSYGVASVMEFTADSQRLPISEGEGPRTTIGADLGFHLSHASRHLGMMEGLRGLLDRPGTATG